MFNPPCPLDRGNRYEPKNTHALCRLELAPRQVACGGSPQLALIKTQNRSNDRFRIRGYLP